MRFTHEVYSTLLATRLLPQTIKGVVSRKFDKFLHPRDTVYPPHFRIWMKNFEPGSRFYVLSAPQDWNTTEEPSLYRTRMPEELREVLKFEDLTWEEDAYSYSHALCDEVPKNPRAWEPLVCTGCYELYGDCTCEPECSQCGQLESDCFCPMCTHCGSKESDCRCETFTPNL